MLEHLGGQGRCAFGGAREAASNKCDLAKEAAGKLGRDVLPVALRSGILLLSR